MQRLLLAGSAMLALAGCATGQPYTGVETGPAAVAERDVHPRCQCPTTSCSPSGPGPMTAFRLGTGSSPSCSRRPSSSASTSSGARSRRSPTIPTPPTFANTIEAMERAGQRLGRVQTIFARDDRQSVDARNPGARQGMAARRLSAAFDEITLDPKLFQRVKALYDARDTLGLDADQNRLLTRDLRVASSATAPSSIRRRRPQLVAINQQLASAFAEFSKRLLADEGTYIAANDAELKGVPQDITNAALAAGKERNLPAGVACDRQHPFGGRSDADLRRQSRASRASVEGVRQTAATMAMPTTPTRSSPRSSSCAPTAPNCSVFRPTPTGGCRTRWPRRRTRRRT